MKRITEVDVLKLLREEYEKREKLNTAKFKGQDSKTDVLTKGLKVRHVETNLLYTVDAVSAQEIFLKTPEGDTFAVTRKDLTRSYKLD